MTREEWLNRLAVKLRPTFEGAGSPLPEKLRISCGWPSNRGLAAKSRTIGQCWPTVASADGTSEVFISPNIDDAATVAAVLVHELVHAALDCEGGHGPVFRKLAVAVGLEGKMTSTTASADLAERLNRLAAKIGPYPHAKLDRSVQKKQGTRMLKVVCPECGYTVRTTRQWIEVGMPTCACGAEMELEGGGDDDDA